MKRKYVQIVETLQSFNSLSACDKFLGVEGITSTILNLPENYHARYNLHIKEIDRTSYEIYKNVDDDTYKNIVSKYEIPCKWCGKPFHPLNIHQYYCDDTHFQTCTVCGTMFDVTQLIKNNKDIPKTCSKRCDIQQRKQTIYEKQKDANYEALKLKKRKTTCLEKYGVDNVSKSPEIKQKIKTQIQNKYGVTNISQRNVKHLDKWAEFLNDQKHYIETHFAGQITISQLSDEFGVSFSSIYNNLTPEVLPFIKRSISYMEEDVLKFLNSLSPDLNIITHYRSAIKPYELDLYLPEYNLAIECNPTITHNSSISIVDKYNIIDKDYHKRKTDLCEENGIFLFHIFGYEWDWKTLQIQSMLRNLIHKNTQKVYARNCTVVELDFYKTKEFLNQNHRQGYTISKINLGLMYNDELVAIMTFGRPRVTITNQGLNDTWELLRYCTKLNCNVTGGASKLFQHFIKKYNPCKIMSFSDRAHTQGHLYNILHFSEVSRSGPNYVWVDLDTNKSYHRMNAQKHNVKKFLKDDSIDLNKTEKQIMEEHGYVQVFDSGTITWVWEPELI